MNLGQPIRAIRKSLPMNQQKFAALVGISQTYMSQIESGKKEPTIKLLSVIAQKLSVPIVVIIWGASSDEQRFIAAELMEGLK